MLQSCISAQVSKCLFFISVLMPPRLTDASGLQTTSGLARLCSVCFRRPCGHSVCGLSTGDSSANLWVLGQTSWLQTLAL